MTRAEFTKPSRKQRVRTLWISDVHLGTRDCQAEHLSHFLKGYHADKVYLVGDIIDGWKMRGGMYWPQAHTNVIRRLLTTHEVAVTIEEGSVGGLGAHVLTMASDAGLTDAGLRIRTMRLPDRFQDQDKPELQYAEAGLDADAVVRTVLKALRWNEAASDVGAASA